MSETPPAHFVEIFKNAPIQFNQMVCMDVVSLVHQGAHGKWTRHYHQQWQNYTTIQKYLDTQNVFISHLKSVIFN